MNYSEFIAAKIHEGALHGFDPLWMPSELFPFQVALAEWSIRKGRAAVFADCGLGKTFIQLTWAENVARQTDGRVLILTPLAVAFQTVKEGEKIGVEVTHRREGSQPGDRIVVTNYERLHYFNPEDFTGVVCDESSILKNFDGSTRAAVTDFMRKMPYRLLCTATAAPNDYIELGTSSEALGDMGAADMLSRFFKKSEKTFTRSQEHRAGLYRFRGHAEENFWRWVCSWSRAMRKPSDMGYDDGAFQLPELSVRSHVVKAAKRLEGYLFDVPAVGLAEQRSDLRRSIGERCEMAAQLANSHDRPAVLWCNLNEEGDLLERMTKHSIQISGKDSDEYKEAVAEWFVGSRCICHDPRFSARVATWQKDHLATGSDIIKNIAKNASARRGTTTGAIENSTESTCDNTTGTIQKSGGERLIKSRSGARTDVLDMPAMLSIATASSLNQSVTESTIQPADPTLPSDASERPSRHTRKRSSLRAENAQSVVPRIPGTDGVTASTSTIAMQPGHIGDCSAQVVTLGSESSETIQNFLSQQRCICGHQSGNRKLISKSTIFGFGMNFQHCAHETCFPSHSYEQYYQMVRRCWRFGQVNPVTVDVITTNGQADVVANLERKAQQASKMFDQLVGMMWKELKIERKDNYTKKEQVPSWL